MICEMKMVIMGRKNGSVGTCLVFMLFRVLNHGMLSVGPKTGVSLNCGLILD
jgi:hypothetical protein